MGGSTYSAGAGMCSYTVAAGDTLAWVAQSMGATTYDIVSANGIANPDFIYVGQVLSNPSCSTGGAGYGAAYDTGAGYGATYDSGAGYDAAYDTGAAVADTAPDYAAAMSEYQVAASYAAGEVAMGAGADYPAGYAPLTPGQRRTTCRRPQRRRTSRATPVGRMPMAQSMRSRMRTPRCQAPAMRPSP
ncbi:MAG: LysM peptidoglycan-binding domain-containing protein [Anaerolineales bacterium]|nr:LysM peptidoglycan-binding domain-containing protein [Anaerolineales bacterium]